MYLTMTRHAHEHTALRPNPAPYKWGSGRDELGTVTYALHQAALTAADPLLAGFRAASSMSDHWPGFCLVARSDQGEEWSFGDFWPFHARQFEIFLSEHNRAFTVHRWHARHGGLLTIDWRDGATVLCRFEIPDMDMEEIAMDREVVLYGTRLEEEIAKRRRALAPGRTGIRDAADPRPERTYAW